MPLKKDLYYLAGLMDADGCFNVSRCRNTYVPRMLVVNTNYDVCEWLKNTFGGDVSKTKVKNKENWKPRYTWRLSHRRALDLADLIADYMIIKEFQGILFRTWACVQDIFKPLERSECYEYLFQELKEANKKGIACQ